MANDTGQLDTSVEIITPENIAFRYQVAGPFRRLPAYLIDLVIRLGVSVLAFLGLMFVFGFAGLPDIGFGVAIVFWFGLAWFYGGLFETFWNGQTPGKRLMQIRVMSVDGQPINGLQAVLRNVLRAVDALPIVLNVIPLYLLGLVTTMMNNRFQRLGDLACGTMVVVEERHWVGGVTRIDEPEAIRLAGQIPPDFQASRTLGRALAAYVQRRKYFPRLRRMEIARHLGEPLRDRFDLPLETDLDQLLCGLYHRTFITDRQEEPPAMGGISGRHTPPSRRSGSPFQEAQSPSVDGTRRVPTTFAPLEAALVEPEDVTIVTDESTSQK